MKPRLWLVKKGVWACGSQKYGNPHIGYTPKAAYSAWLRSMK